MTSATPESLFDLRSGEGEALFSGLRNALLARHAPADEIERHWVEELAFALWRQRRLRSLEAAVLASFDNLPNEPESAAPALPSLATLARYRARIERDHRLALAELERLQEQRRQQPATKPDQLRFLADLLERNGEESTGEPEDGPAEPPALNRHERRRLAALGRRAA